MLALQKKSYDQTRQHIKKHRCYFANQGPSSQSYDFSSCHVWIWELDYEKAEAWKSNVFKLSCWRRLLRVSWTARRSNQFILKEISSEYSLKVLMLKLILQYFGHLMWRTDSLEETLMLGKTEGRRRGLQRMRWLDDITDSMDMSLSKLWECCSPWGHKELDMTEWLKWTIHGKISGEEFGKGSRRIQAIRDYACFIKSFDTVLWAMVWSLI